MSSDSDHPAPTLVYSALAVAGLWLITRLPLLAITALLLRILLALVRPALLVLGAIHLWEKIPNPSAASEAEDPPTLAELRTENEITLGQ